MRDIDEEIKELISSESSQTIIEYIKTNYHDVRLKPSVLGDIFIHYINVIGWENEEEGISPEILIEELCLINKWFKSTNGCQWARSDSSTLGKKYIIERRRKGNSVYSIKLIGFNDKKIDRSIKPEIYNEIRKERCVVLDVGTQIEVDHKNGRYDNEVVLDKSSQTLDDFQPLHKTVNNAKRQHCKECMNSKKRYDASRLGYKEGWIVGDENDLTCIGCYWYDPKEFNQTISKDFKKEE